MYLQDIKNKYLGTFIPLIQKQLYKYLERNRIDSNSFSEGDINTQNTENLDLYMKNTYRSDMTRRNVVWENLTKLVNELSKTSDSGNIIKIIDRINNNIHNTGDLILTKLDNGSELLKALDICHSSKVLPLFYIDKPLRKIKTK